MYSSPEAVKIHLQIMEGEGMKLILILLLTVIPISVSARETVLIPDLPEITVLSAVDAPNDAGGEITIIT